MMKYGADPVIKSKSTLRCYSRFQILVSCYTCASFVKNLEKRNQTKFKKQQQQSQNPTELPKKKPNQNHHLYLKIHHTSKPESYLYTHILSSPKPSLSFVRGEKNGP